MTKLHILVLLIFAGINFQQFTGLGKAKFRPRKMFYLVNFNPGKMLPWEMIIYGPEVFKSHGLKFMKNTALEFVHIPRTEYWISQPWFLAGSHPGLY